MKSMRRVIAMIALLAVAISAVACSSGGADPAKLEGDWMLESFGGAKALEPADPSVTTTLTMKSGKAEGSGGVNSYGASYEAKPGEIKFEDVTSTLIAGPEPAATQEKRFFDALAKTRHFEFNGDKLILTTRNNDTLVVLTPK